MLKFFRPNFRAGVVLVREPSEAGTVTYRFTVRDQNQNFTFIDNAYVLANYPILFTEV